MTLTTKDKILALLKENSGTYLSGQQLADQLYVSRAAVWKAIHRLKEEGYPIDGINNKGYRLVMAYTPISANILRGLLDNEKHIPDIEVFEQVSSTNDAAREIAHGNQRKETVLIADEQTRGRGRNTHSFFSPQGTGLYMSFLLYPDIEPSQASRITCMAAVAVKEALERFSEEPVRIKWVNDLFLGERKIAGILTEAGVSLEQNRISYAVVGIGINLLPPKEGFPHEIEHIAGALYPNGNQDSSIRSKICAEIIRNVMHYYHSDQKDEWLSAYKAASMLTGHYIKIKDAADKNHTYAQVLGIDDACRLICRYEDLTEEALQAGEVSVVRY